MSQAPDDLVARVQDPQAPLETLHELAQDYPGLRPYIAANPRTYPDLLDWLGSLGDPAVDAALAARGSEQISSTAPLPAVDAPTQPQAAVGADTQALPPGAAPTAGAPTQALPPGAAPTEMGSPTQALAGLPQPNQAWQGVPPSAPTAVQAPDAAAQAWAPSGAEAGIFGLGGEPPAEPERHRGGAILWVLSCVVLFLVVAVATWFFTSGSSDPAPSANSAKPSQSQESKPSASTRTPSQTPSSTPTPSPTPSPTPELRYPAPAGAVEMTSFTSPSGNITCTLGESSVSCTINEHSFTSTDASCSQGISQPFTASVGTNGQATGTCGTPFSPSGATLNYGSSATHGTFACTSTETGVECWSQVSGQGFTIARSGAQGTSR